jgi:hypothetical protein
MIRNIKVALVSFILAVVLFFCNRERCLEDQKNKMAERIKAAKGHLLVQAESTEKK